MDTFITSSTNCCNPKDRSSISTAATDNTTSPANEEYSEHSEILEEDLVEFDELEKDLLLKFDQKRKLMRQNSNLSVCSSDSSTGSKSPKRAGRRSPRNSATSSGTSRAKSRSRSPKPTKSPKYQRSATSSSVLAREQEKRIKLRMRRAITLDSYEQDSVEQSSEANHDKANEQQQQTPNDCLREILHAVSTSTFKSETWEGGLITITPERVASYSEEAAQAIRGDQLAALEQLHKDGKVMDSCNSHGESLLHLACRLGKMETIRYLVEDANVSLRVQDDCGRTPLTDACWTNKPDFMVMKYILDRSPDLLFIQDKRGFTAFQYIPQACWEAWCEFLRSEQDFLLRKVKESGYQRAQNQLDDAQARLQALMKKAANY